MNAFFCAIIIMIIILIPNLMVIKWEVNIIKIHYNLYETNRLFNILYIGYINLFSRYLMESRFFINMIEIYNTLLDFSIKLFIKMIEINEIHIYLILMVFGIIITRIMFCALKIKQ